MYRFSFQHQKLRFFSSVLSPEYAFEMSSSLIRFGRGVTKEIGADVVNMGFRDKICVVTDKKLVNMSQFQLVADSLSKSGVAFEVFDDVSVEPTDYSLQAAADFCKKRQFEAFIAVGGGSVMDTAKAANAYMCNPNFEFLDFVNAPIGKGMPIPTPLKTLIAVPTTAGTGIAYFHKKSYCHLCIAVNVM